MINMAFEKQSSFHKGKLTKAREMAKKMIEYGDSDEKIMAVSGFSKEEVVVLRSEMQ